MEISVEDRKRFALEYLKVSLQLSAPFDTGNLMLNGIRIDLNQQAIIIGGEIADYAVYTNEPWIDEKWNGRSNPNEGWIQKGVQQAQQGIFNIFGGVYSQQEIEDIMYNKNADLSDKINERREELKNE